MVNPNVVVVTGVSSGIGRATAELFAKQSYQVFGTVRNIAKVEPIKGVTFIEMDVREERSVNVAFADIFHRASRVDILINNAGMSCFGCVEEHSVQEAKDLFDTNLYGVLRTVKAALPNMRAQGAGRIVNVSSVLGFLPAPGQGLYGASKHALEGLSETLDHEVRGFGIRVSLVEPSFTKTNFDANSSYVAEPMVGYEKIRSQITRAIDNNLGKAPGPEQVAQTIFKAATESWTMRHTPGREASVLRVIRRLLPSAMMSGGIRKTFGLQ